MESSTLKKQTNQVNLIMFEDLTAFKLTLVKQLWYKEDEKMANGKSARKCKENNLYWDTHE